MFIFRTWEDFCSKLDSNKVYRADELLENFNREQFLILKHDVETDLTKALIMAKIEKKYGLKGSYYIQGYLLNNQKNIEIIKEIQRLGHEVSYHYDVMDSNGGNYFAAKKEFDDYLKLFNSNGFRFKTVCQHGNPLVDRVNYTSNRDFFRNKKIKEDYKNLFDIVVDFKEQIQRDYKYISDAGYGWKIIFDPENNDVIDSSHNDIKMNTLNDILDIICKGESVIISTHSHRWGKSEWVLVLKNTIFKIIKAIAKKLYKIKFLKKIMNKYYYLAKKI